MLNPAAFSINATPSADPVSGDKIYRFSSGDTLAVALENNPAPGVLSVIYELFDANNPESPQASKSARAWWPTALLFTESSSVSVVPANVQDTVHIVAPASTGLPGAGTASWVLRARAQTPDGEFIFDRGIALNAFPDWWREPVPAERDEFYARGWDFTWGAIVSHAFPVRRALANGATNAVAVSYVGGITPTKNRDSIASFRVWARNESGGGSSLWKIECKVSTDSSGNVTIDANSFIATKSAGGSQIADTDWVPTIAVNGAQVAVKLNHLLASHTFTYEAWLELTEHIAASTSAPPAPTFHILDDLGSGGTPGQVIKDDLGSGGTPNAEITP